MKTGTQGDCGMYSAHRVITVVLLLFFSNCTESNEKQPRGSQCAAALWKGTATGGFFWQRATLPVKGLTSQERPHQAPFSQPLKHQKGVKKWREATAQPHSTSLGWTDWWKARPYRPTSVLDFTDGLVAEWEKIPAARFQNLMIRQKAEKWRLLALEWDAQQSHKSVIIVRPTYVWLFSVHLRSLCSTHLLFSACSLLSAQIKNRQTKTTKRYTLRRQMHSQL